MKKRNLFIIAIVALIGVALVFNACKKDPDATKPVITLKNATGFTTADMTITFNSAYTEPGYTASDDIDGDITSKVTVSGTVNIKSAGLSTLTYSVTDAAGNSGTATRKVTVDAGPFLVGSYSVIDDNHVDPPYTYGDNVTISTTDLNKIYFHKFAYYTDGVVYVTLSGTTVTLPSQTVMCGPTDKRANHTFTGTGTFTTSKGIVITYRDIFDLNSVHYDFQNCTETYTIQ